METDGKKKFNLISFNAPVILSFTFLSLIISVISWITKGSFGIYFSAYKTSFADPMQYIRLFTHIFVHDDFSHYMNNFLLILLVGPMVEEKYGSIRLLIMIALTSAITGVLQIFIFPNAALMGASGIVFMLILLSSFVNIKEGRIPVTALIVAALYLGEEVYKGIFVKDNISRMAHVVGGLCGGLFGFLFYRKKQ